MKFYPALEEFLELCEQTQSANGHSINAHGSDVVESDSLVESSTVADQALSSTTTDESLGHHLQLKIDESASMSPLEQVCVTDSSESYRSPVAHSTPRPCEERVGFWIDPDEISEDLRQDTVALTIKYLFR